MDPLWNSLVVGGLQTDKDGQLKPFLGFLGMIGTSYEDAHVATGDIEHEHQSCFVPKVNNLFSNKHKVLFMNMLLSIRAY